MAITGAFLLVRMLAFQKSTLFGCTIPLKPAASSNHLLYSPGSSWLYPSLVLTSQYSNNLTNDTAKFVLITPPLKGKSPPTIKTLGFVIHKKTTNLPANGSRFLFSVATSLPMGWDWAWDIPSKHYLFNHLNKKTSKNIYIQTTTKLGSLSRVLFNRRVRTRLLIGRDQPKVVPNIFWDCGCWSIRTA